VLPSGLYLRVGLEGIGVDVYEEHLGVTAAPLLRKSRISGRLQFLAC